MFSIFRPGSSFFGLVIADFLKSTVFTWFLYFLLKVNVLFFFPFADISKWINFINLKFIIPNIFHGKCFQCIRKSNFLKIFSQIYLPAFYMRQLLPDFSQFRIFLPYPVLQYTPVVPYPPSIHPSPPLSIHSLLHLPPPSPPPPPQQLIFYGRFWKIYELLNVSSPLYSLPLGFNG